MSDQFSTGRTVAVILELFGWALVVFGGLLFLFAFTNSRSVGIVATIPAVQILVGGLLQIAGAQVIKAVIITAENSMKIRTLLESTAQHASGQEYGVGKQNTTAPAFTPRDGKIKVYKGHVLLRKNGAVMVEGVDQEFGNVIAAERFVDGR